MLTLEIFPDNYAICRLKPGKDLPDWAVQAESDTQSMISVTRTPDELSIVCRESQVPAGGEAETDWRCSRGAGKLDFSLVGIIAEITRSLANSGISVFVISTFDTDYFLVKKSQWAQAERTLSDAGYAMSSL